ncbi:hypothetical protein ACLD0W_12520 [Alloalcanivorax sp. C16-1]|uniref:phage head spike fiber domain-containing protein n=1 Tax=Alloalcanivorax sp. C16-1 TaxID=3390051 RepID=UPI003970DA21
MNRRTGPFTAAVTLTRPEPAPYIDRNGVQQEAAANQPRFNYDAGQPEGLLLDSLLTEHAALVPDPAFNELEGTWMFTGALENARPLPGSGFDELLTGEGTLVLVYQGGAGQCWAGGQVLYTVDPIAPAMATAITAGGDARAALHQYRPYAISDTEAAQLAAGAFEIVTPPALLADLEEQEYGTRDESGAFQRKPYTGVLDLTRPGPTTVWDAQGNLVTVPSGEPAFDHDPVSGAPLGQQIVAFPVTNYFRSSTTLTYWDETNATITTAGEPVPFVEGGMADVLTANAGNFVHGMRSTVYVNQGNQTRYTYIVKPSNIKRVGWGRYAIDGAELIVFDFETVSVVQESAAGFVNGSIVALRDGWFKITFTLSAGVSTTAYLPRFYFLPPTVTGSYDGTNAAWEMQGNESLAFFFLQATDGDVDLPLIYTTNSQQTRPADNPLQLATEGGVPPGYSGSRLTFFAEIIPEYDPDSGLTQIILSSQYALTEYLRLQISTTSSRTGDLYLLLRGPNGVQKALDGPDTLIVPGQRNKVAFHINETGDMIAAGNGVSFSTEYDQLPRPAPFRLFSSNVSGNLGASWFDTKRIYTAAQLEELTTL